jgi:GT2 family glycosyltransferase
MKVAIIILNYNGEKLIPLCLPSIIEAKKNSKYDTEIIVIDNESTDASIEILGSFKDEVSTVKHKNEFLCSFNDVVLETSADIVILFNNDIKVDRNFINPLIEVFAKKKDTFLVAPKVLDFKGNLEGANTKGYLHFGLFWASAKFKNWQKSVNVFSHTFSSGFGAFDRKKFIQIGGYDDLYLPGRFEDMDLGLRAWRRGWRLYYQPESVVYHLGQATFKKKFGKRGIDLIDARNLFIFIWKNLYSYKLWIEHLFFLPFWFIWWAVKGKFFYFKGFFLALKRWKEIIEKKSQNFYISEEVIFALFKK